MHRNYRKYNKIDTQRYSQRIKSSFWSLISISTGLLFTYLAMTNPVNDENTFSEKNQTNITDTYEFVKIKRNLTPPEEKKTKDNKGKRNEKNSSK